MRIINNTIRLETENGTGVYDITAKVRKMILDAGINNGSVLVFTKHTTTAIRINESEPCLIEDIKKQLESIASKKKSYLHDDFEIRNCPPDERINGHAHLKALSLNTSEIIPIVNRELALGKWQSIFFFELDGAREREVIVQVRGE